LYIWISSVLGETAQALAFTRQQQLGGREYLAIGFLEAVRGDRQGWERAFAQYQGMERRIAKPGFESFRAVGDLLLAESQKDSEAMRSAEARMPHLNESRTLLLRARCRLLLKDHGAAEQLLRRALVCERWIGSFGTLCSRSPLTALLCHFYLGRVYEATGKADRAADEYKTFLKPFGARAPLPQVTQARAALARLARP
jgi:hypothetical protein